jgi:hypothetical protein
MGKNFLLLLLPYRRFSDSLRTSSEILMIYQDNDAIKSTGFDFEPKLRAAERDIGSQGGSSDVSRQS